MTQADPTLTEGTNSYITYADALVYFGNRFNNTAWDNLSELNRIRALITASLQISRLVATDYKLPLTPPAAQGLKDATCELALAMAADNAVIDQANTGKNVRTVKAGSASVEFFKPTKGSRFPPVVMDILRSNSLIGAAGISAPVATGTTVCSSFDTADIYNINNSLSS